MKRNHPASNNTYYYSVKFYPYLKSQLRGFSKKRRIKLNLILFKRYLSFFKIFLTLDIHKKRLFENKVDAFESFSQLPTEFLNTSPVGFR